MIKSIPPENDLLMLYEHKNCNGEHRRFPKKEKRI